MWKGWVCCQRVCFSLSFSEMAVLVFVCQEHGKWCLEKRRKGKEGRMQEGRGGCLRVWCMLECLPVGVPVWRGVAKEFAFH